MKLLGVRADPLSAVRRRAALVAEAAQMPGAVQAPDSASFLGIVEAELTPAVRAALTRLISEIDELRGEVGRLKARLNEAEDLADLDALTPLLNRRAFLRELKRILAFSQRFGGPCSLVYFDLEGFKAVNDRFGHAAGDEALKGVAERLAAHVREGDVIGRIGGDEFGVILVQADLGAALARAGAMAAAIETQPVACGDWLVPLKITYGVRQLDPGMTAEEALGQADHAMYAQRRAG
ncbi:GGDEF domain-containing protein [Phenylobacterium montanum]|uniref:diguanylate cyclase n=1 Tax=Phenylobacterium montanum TaxID=2823693 RepID=A0A975IV84_9CAUL|nr:GGDEF domain-containing protein [Caulobacter sp. S6]QUD87046.1 diguanylate cyclase [Caulobacter sp. S6]